jgi:Ca2+-binding RTX toxin-like protein
MDVFIANGYETPSFSSELLTNFDYEVLVHELGHALGLKHPFEASGANTETLSTFEDNTRNTAMSYDDDTATFNGTFRALDWMALAKLYGVKSTYKAEDHTYEFSSSGGIFILDGGGIDTITAYDTPYDATIDLRPGAHSHLGTKSNYITSANQLTISHGSDIENVITGSGDDIVIGTDLDNLIATGGGADTIFAGGGADTIKSGSGADQIDLSESVQFRDTLTLDTSSVDFGIDTIYGFSQGALGDILDVSVILSSFFELFPLVVSGSAPTANFGGGILRLTGSDVSNASDLSGAFRVGGSLETLSISSSGTAMIISADSQDTGEDQSIFSVENSGGEISVIQLAILQGNALDIDQWHADNFTSST